MLLGYKYNKCNTDEERLTVILEEISRCEAESRENPQDVQRRRQLNEILEHGLKLARQMGNTDDVERELERKL